MLNAIGVCSSDDERWLENSSFNSIETILNETDANIPESTEPNGYYDAVEFTWFDAMFSVISFALYLSNMIIHVYLVSMYNMNEYSWYFILTLSLVLLPTVAISVFQALEYMNRIKFSKLKRYPLPSFLERGYMCLVFLITLIPQSQTGVIYYGIKYNKELEKEAEAGGFPDDKQWKKIFGRYVVMLYVNKRTTALLSLIVGFLGCAPQILLQLHIMASADNLPISLTYWQYASVSVSIISLAWAVASFIPMRKLYTTETEESSFIVIGVVFLIQLLEIGSRAIALSLFAAVISWIVWPVVLMYHFLAVSSMAQHLGPKTRIRQLEYEDDSRTNESWWERLRLAIFGTIVSMFTLMHNDNRQHTRRYRVLCLVENVIMITVCLTNSTRDTLQFFKLAIHFALFLTAHFTWKLLLKYGTRLNQIARLLESNGNGHYKKPDAQLDGEFKTFHFVTLIFTLLLHLAHVGTDISLAVEYHNRNGYRYFCLTLACVLLPALVTSCRNLWRYLKAWKNSNHGERPSLPKWAWRLRTFCSVLFPLSSVPCCVEHLYHGVQYEIAKNCGNRKDVVQHFTSMNKANANGLTNQMTVAFLESTPQLALQLYAIVIEPEEMTKLLPIVSIMFSALSMAWTLTSWRLFLMEHDAKLNVLKTFLNDNRHYVMATSVLSTASHVASIFLRTYLIVLSSATFGLSVVLPAIFLHVIVTLSLFVAFVERDIKFKNGVVTPLKRFVLLLIGSIVTMFSYCHNSGRFRRLFYYPIWFAENIIALLALLSGSEHHCLTMFTVCCLASCLFDFLSGLCYSRAKKSRTNSHQNSLPD